MLVRVVRGKNKKRNSLEKAAKSAINYCIKNNILKDYLEAHASEVLNMLLGAWNQEEALEVAREEGLEDGREEERHYVLELINQGLTMEEIKERLQKEEVF